MSPRFHRSAIFAALGKGLRCSLRRGLPPAKRHFRPIREGGRLRPWRGSRLDETGYACVQQERRRLSWSGLRPARRSHSVRSARRSVVALARFSMCNAAASARSLRNSPAVRARPRPARRGHACVRSGCRWPCGHGFRCSLPPCRRVLSEIHRLPSIVPRPVRRGYGLARSGDRSRTGPAFEVENGDFQCDRTEFARGFRCAALDPCSASLFGLLQ